MNLIGKIIFVLQIILVAVCMVMFMVSNVAENTNGLIYWGVLALFNLVSVSDGLRR